MNMIMAPAKEPICVNTPHQRSPLLPASIPQHTGDSHITVGEQTGHNDSSSDLIEIKEKSLLLSHYALC